jgi:hypothetical protein
MFSPKYFLRRFFPAAWFGGSVTTGGAQVANMAAGLHGAGAAQFAARADAGIAAGGFGGCEVVAGLVGLGLVGAGCSGSGGFVGDLDTDQAGAEQPAAVGGTPHGPFLERRRERKNVVVGMAADLSGRGQLQGRGQAMIAARADIHGRGAIRAMPVIDISRLLARRREEEELAAVLLMNYELRIMNYEL